MAGVQSNRGPFPIEHAYAAIVGYVLGAYIDFVSDEEIRLDWGERRYPATRKIRGKDAFKPVDTTLKDWNHWMTLQVAGFANISDPRAEDNAQLRELARQAVGNDSQEITKLIRAAKQRAERILAREEAFRDYLTTRLMFGLPEERQLDAEEFARRARSFNVRRQLKAKGRSQSIYRALESALAGRFGSGLFSIVPESTPRRIVISSTTTDGDVIQPALEMLSQRGYHTMASQGEPTYILAIQKET